MEGRNAFEAFGNTSRPNPNFDKTFMIQGSTASLGDEGTSHDLGHIEVPNSFATIQTTYGGNMATLVQHGLSVPKVPNLGMRGSYLKGGSNVKKGQ